MDISQAEREDFGQEVLDEMLDCGNQCSDIGTFSTAKPKPGFALIEHYLNVLPGISYIQAQLVNYIFSNGMSAGGITENATLNRFLYRLNRQNITNYAVLRDAVGQASVYGECGIRWYEDDIYIVKPGTYAPAVRTVDGLDEVMCYFVTKDGSYLSDADLDIDSLTVRPETLTVDRIRRHFAGRGLIMLDKSEFVSLRNTTTSLHGESPLLKDQLRLDLLVTAYERLNYDLKYDGPGRLILRPKSGCTNYGDNDVSTTEVINQSVAAQKNRAEKAKAEARRVAKEIKNSSSDSIVLLSNAFDEKIEKLERVTKATEFFDWIDNEAEILADVMGLPPSLLEAGDLSGNVSMTRIIDNAMVNAIIPIREHYATQFSPMLANKLGLERVFFDKYTLQSEESKNSARLKVATTMQQLGTIENNPQVTALINEFAKMLDYDIHDSVGGIVELSLGRIDENTPYKEGSKEDEHGK